MKGNDRIRYYQTFTDDFVQSGDQDCRLPEDYVWVRKDLRGRFLAKLIYAAAWLFSLFYCRFYLHVRVVNRSLLKKYRDGGCYLYGNHTQPMGDAFTPAYICTPRHIYTVAGPANLGIPVLGKLLPLMGALPTPGSLSQMRQFLEAIRTRIGEKKCVILYPEAHVWPWYTGIRPFPETSFRFPVEIPAPSFCMTTTYQRKKSRAPGFLRKPGRDSAVEDKTIGTDKGRRARPVITVYIDGPFYPDSSLPKKAQQKKLCEEIHACMVRRSENSTYEYIHYEKAQPMKESAAEEKRGCMK